MWDLILIAFGAYLMIFNGREARRVAAWHTKTALKFPNLYPKWMRGIFYNRMGAILIGFGLIFLGVAGLFTPSSVTLSEEKIQALERVKERASQMGVSYFFQSEKTGCRRFQYLNKSEGKFHVLADSACKTGDEDDFTPTDTLAFDEMARAMRDPVLADENINALFAPVSTTDGSVKSISFWITCDGYCDPVAYVYDPEHYSPRIDPTYLTQIKGLWFAERYHPSPF